VAIATPAETHYTLAKEALLRGKDVFVEKPLSLSVEEGIDLNRIAREKNRVLMVGHLLQYHPAVMKLKELADSGELGKIYYIYSNRLNLGRIRQEENILWSFAPHDISVILSLTGQMPEAVASFGGQYLQEKIADVTMSTLSFPNGIRAHIFVSWLHPFKEQKFIVVGSEKMAVFDDVEKKDKLLVFPHKISWRGNIPVPDRKDAEVVGIDLGLEPLKQECSHFLECVRLRGTPRTDGEEGLRVLRVLNACQRSLESQGKTVGIHEAPVTEKPYFVHHSAVVDEPASIGKGTDIWHFSHILKGSRIGKDCRIGQNVVIGPNVGVGNSVKIQNNVSVYEGVTLEDHVFHLGVAYLRRGERPGVRAVVVGPRLAVQKLVALSPYELLGGGVELPGQRLVYLQYPVVRVVDGYEVLYGVESGDPFLFALRDELEELLVLLRASLKGVKHIVES